MRVAAVYPAGEGSCNVWLEGLRLHELGIRPGQFLLFRFLARGHLLTAHPYSVSQMPQNGRLRITVADSGDHSRRMRVLKAGTPVFVEGPFGRFTADLAGAPRVLLVAGGAGIAPIAALAREFSGRGRQVVLAYRARSASHLALSDELRELPGVALLPLVGRRRELGYDPLSAHHLVELIPEIWRYEAFVCGPPGMTATACTELHRAGISRRKIHYEEMSLS
jgi:ferredoxin-NADP reductase